MSSPNKRKVNDFLSAEEYAKLTPEEKVQKRKEMFDRKTENMTEEEKEVYKKELFEKSFDKLPQIKVYHSDGRSERAILSRIRSRNGKNFIILQNRNRSILQWLSLEDFVIKESQ